MLPVPEHICFPVDRYGYDSFIHGIDIVIGDVTGYRYRNAVIAEKHTDDIEQMLLQAFWRKLGAA